MKIVCTKSNMAWFTPGEVYEAVAHDENDNLIRIMQDNLIPDLNEYDAWLAVKIGGGYLIPNQTEFKDADE